MSSPWKAGVTENCGGVCVLAEGRRTGEGRGLRGWGLADLVLEGVAALFGEG